MKFILLILIALACTGLMSVLAFFVFKRIFPRDMTPEKTHARFYKNMQKRGNGHIATRVKDDLHWLDDTEHEEVRIKSFDKYELYGRFYRSPEHCGKTVILLHGYRSSAAIDFGSQFPFLLSLGCNILAVDQRAHGKSEGDYVTLGVAERFDAIEWANWVKENLGEDEGVILYGASMGATTALLASAEEELPENVIGIIADSGYIGPTMQVGLMLRKKHIPLNPFMNLIEIFCMSKGRFSMRDCTTTNAMPHCQAPVLFIHGEADALVPHDDSRINHEQCAARNEYLLVPSAEHTRAFITDEELCKETIEAFIASLEGPPSPDRELRALENAANDSTVTDEEYGDDEYDDSDEYEDDDEYDDEDEDYEDEDDEEDVE